MGIDGGTLLTETNCSLIVRFFQAALQPTKHTSTGKIEEPYVASCCHEYTCTCTNIPFFVKLT